MFIRKIVLAASLFLFAISLSAQAGETVKIGYFRLAPHVISEGKTDASPMGAAVDYWQHLAKEMGMTVEWVGPLPMKRLLASLERGIIDAILLLAKNKERADKFLYPEKPFADLAPGIMVKKSRGLEKVEDAGELAGMKIGYFSGGYVSPFMRDERIKLDLNASTQWLNINFKKFDGGRIDAVYNPDTVSLKYEYGKFGDTGKVRFIVLPEKGMGLYTVFSKKSRSGLVDRYNTAHGKLMGEHSYDDLIMRY